MDSDAGSDASRRWRPRDESNQFLSSADQGTTPSKRKKPDDGHLGVPTGLEQRIAEGAQARWERASRRRQASAAPAEGTMESKYPTAVSRMMAKMGFKPGSGLGKDGQGILAPLEAVLRPAHAGLGSVEEPKPFFYGKENLPPPPAPAEEELERPRWSRKAGAVRKGNVLTKNALLATRVDEEQDEQVPMVVEKVIDMRGPHARVLTDLRGLNDGQEMEVDDAVPMPELDYNLRLLVDEAAADIKGLDAQLRLEREKVASLMREKENPAAVEASQAHQLQVMEAITSALDQVQADEAAGVLTPEALLDTFGELKTRHKEEFALCGLAWIACEFARPLLVRKFHGWQPLSDSSFGLVLTSPLKDLLQKQQQPYDFTSDGTDPYGQLVQEVIMPAVRASCTNSWDARDPEPMLHFLESWESLLPPTVIESILEDFIMPKLSAAIDSWDPHKEMPIHVWVHPWLPALKQARTETLCHSVRYKLSSTVLRSWQSHDGSAYAVLSPWKGLFDPASWEAMMARYIVPKLKPALQELQISPRYVDCQKELHDFKDRVMIWASVIPARHMVHLLEADFFGKWLLVLYHWLRWPDPDFDEVVAWYKSWSGIFPPELLANDRVRMLLGAGLAMMNNAAEGREVLPPGAREAAGCPKAAEDHQQFDTVHQVPGDTMEGWSFKDRIDEYARDQGVLFMHRAGKFYNGVPVYEFGSVRVCLDSVKGLLYAQVQGSWSAVTLSELMEMNRMAKPC